MVDTYKAIMMEHAHEQSIWTKLMKRVETVEHRRPAAAGSPVKYAADQKLVCSSTAGALHVSCFINSMTHWKKKTSTQKCKEHVFHAPSYGERSVPLSTTP